MPKFIICVEDEYEVIEAKSLADAEDIAYETWLQRVDEGYSAEEYTRERAVELDLADGDGDGDAPANTEEPQR